ncbi:hypothetical protein LCGC14_2189150 [marine sediment metagenome]|uniref:Transposase IS4-like domain-containing protein n=1 Tax=marine sediment metagenome TaxID=412755 RepID=A0A0F9E719_9ZZZZ
MPELHIKDIIIEFDGDDLTKYGLFPLFAWFLMDYLLLPQYFKGLTVKKKRNRKRPIKRRKPKFDISQMCMGIITAILLGVERFRKINDVLSTETKIAELVGLPEFFDQSTVHVLVLDIDSTTHSLESRKREKAVVGHNKKNRGKPCYQWSAAFVRGEVVSQKLNKGNSHCISCFKEIVASVAAKLEKPISIIRVDGGYFSGDTLEWTIEKGYQIVTIERYKWIMSQKPKIDPDKWIEYNSDTKLYDLGRIKIISTTEAIFRAILVDTRQHPFGKKQLKKKHIRYAIVENLATELSASALYEFYHGRQTIENFFKESKNPFNSGKMPSQKFRANEAYLQFVAIAYNSYSWFKKNFFHQPGKLTLWRPQELN